MKAIYLLRRDGVVRGSYIAKLLGVTKPTVSVSLKEMADDGYIRILDNRSIELTEQGEKIARDVVERNETIFGLLTDIGVNSETAYQDACRIEHGLSDESLDAIIELRKHLHFTRNFPLSDE